MSAALVHMGAEHNVRTAVLLRTIRLHGHTSTRVFTRFSTTRSASPFLERSPCVTPISHTGLLLCSDVISPCITTVRGQQHRCFSSLQRKVSAVLLLITTACRCACQALSPQTPAHRTLLPRSLSQPPLRRRIVGRWLSGHQHTHSNAAWACFGAPMVA